MSFRFAPFLCLTIFAFFGFSAVADWKLERDYEGILVYTKTVAGSSYKAFKGEIYLDAKLDKVKAVFRDIPSFHKWMSNTRSTKVVEKLGENACIHYVEVEAPWPVSDRDGYYEFNYLGLDNGGLRINVKGVPNYAPEKSDYVRLQESKGYWLIEPTDGKVKVTYQMHAEPGGYVPAWAANQSIVETPFFTLKQLRDFIK